MVFGEWAFLKSQNVFLWLRTLGLMFLVLHLDWEKQTNKPTSMACNFLHRRTEQKDNDCPKCFRATSLLLVQLLCGSLVILTLSSHHAQTAASQMSPPPHPQPHSGPPAAQTHRLLVTGIFNLAVTFHCFSQVDKKVLTSFVSNWKHMGRGWPLPRVTSASERGASWHPSLPVTRLLGSSEQATWSIPQPERNTRLVDWCPVLFHCWVISSGNKNALEAALWVVKMPIHHHKQIYAITL